MFAGSKEEHDLIIQKTLDKVTKMELDRNLVHRSKIHSWHEAIGLLREELAETEEALKMTVSELETFEKAIFHDYRNEEIIKQAELAAFNAGLLMQEALHVRAVVLKAVAQLKNAPTDDNQ